MAGCHKASLLIHPTPVFPAPNFRLTPPDTRPVLWYPQASCHWNPGNNKRPHPVPIEKPRISHLPVNTDKSRYPAPSRPSPELNWKTKEWQTGYTPLHSFASSNFSPSISRLANPCFPCRRHLQFFQKSEIFQRHIVKAEKTTWIRYALIQIVLFSMKHISTPAYFLWIRIVIPARQNINIRFINFINQTFFVIDLLTQ